MTGYCALPSHFSQASLTPNHILKTKHFLLVVALHGCCSTISRGSTLCCGLQTAPRSPVGGLCPWPEWRVVLTVLGCQLVTHILKHSITNCQKYSDISRKYQNKNTKHSLHHSPISSPSQQQLFSFCFPLANVNSRSTNPPIVNFLPTPITKKKAKHPV